jgi:predicted nucleotidyltransferase component of viral defense system
MTKYASQLIDFSKLIQASAQARNLPPEIIEKDYFLCRGLRVLDEAYRGRFVLKGGTSLSKGWQLLKRFSEDIDLLLIAGSNWGKARRDTLLKAFAETVASTEGFKLGERVREAETGVHRTVVFVYPTLTNELSGLSKSIRLEMGYRGESVGAVRRPIQSFVGEFAAAKGQFGLAEDLASFEIDLQSAKRTFVEKLFAAYAAFETDRAARHARHYYDLYELCRLDEVRAFVGSDEYRKTYLEAKAFALEFDSPVPATDSFADCHAFKPAGEERKSLGQNYEREASLFFSQQPKLDDVLEAIGVLLARL